MKYGIITLLMAVAALAAPQAAVQRTVLQQNDLSVPGREGVLARAEFPARGTTGRHTHPGDEISYVLQGTLRLEIDGQPAREFKAGDTFMIPAGKVHNATNTAAGTTTVLGTYIIEKGKPLATPAP
jgi:quercetin dioxygenase-like cupin family protein